MLKRLCLGVAILGLYSTAIAGVFYVDEDASPGGDGMTWGSAFNSIQDAIDAADADNGGEVWVAEGTYTGLGGVIDVDGDPAGECVVVLAENVQLYGGFSGTETQRTDRDWNVHETIIDGEDQRRCVSGISLSVIDGFTVTDGNATNGVAYETNGGGFFNFGDSGEIRNCTIKENTAKYGAGIYNHYSSPTVSGCLILDNEAINHGGGMSNITTSSPLITNCVFAGNSAGLTGGALNNHNSSLPELINCTIVNNSAGENGGGVSNTTNSVPTFKNSILFMNGEEVYNVDSGSGAICTYCCVRRGYSGVGNISSDPMIGYYDPIPDYTLPPSSPCVDAGTNVGAPVTDILGVTRPMGPKVDMGAYEFVHVAPVASCKDFTVELGVSGTATLAPSDLDDGSSDDVAIAGMTLSTEAFTCADLGDQSVTLTVTDSAGYTDQCTATVTVVDKGAPVITLNGESEVILTVGDDYSEPGAFATDACTGDITVVIGGDNVDTDIADVYHVTYDASDSNGNDTETVIRTVSVIPQFRDVWYVDSQASSPSPNGTSWELAYPDIQPAIDAASFSGASETNTTEIWVADGVYSGVGGVALVDDQSAGECVIVLSQGVQLFGGFAGDETAKSQRNWTDNLTIIDGEDIRRGVGGEKFSTLDGFNVINGRATGSGLYDNRGGGIFNFGDSVNISNCTFENNLAAYGGGIYNHYSSPVIRQCFIINNEALNHAGGIDNLTTSYPEIVNCVIAGNIAGGSGGGINNYNSSSPVITNCTIVGNSASDNGGGIINIQDASPVITNCILWDNSSAIYNEGTSSGPLVEYCCIQGGYSGDGNFSRVPQFVDRDFDDYRLDRLSPCIDAGTQDGAPIVDLSGVQRPLRQGVDIGAYEYNDLLPIAIGRNLTVELESDGIVMVTPEEVDFGSSDDLEIVSMTLSQDVFSCDDIGSNEITFTVEDGDGNTDTCTVTISVLDTTAPVITLLGTQVLSVDLGGTFVDPGALVSDSCDDDIDISVTGDTVNTETIGSYYIDYNAFDDSRNVAQTVTRTVRVQADWRNVWYVDADQQSYPINGISWETAFMDIQSAVNIAASSGASEETPCEIWVADGHYNTLGGYLDIGDQQAGACGVILKEGIHLYGGFAGTETSRSQRDWIQYESIIDGGGQRRCVAGADYSKIDGFTIRNGNATDDSFDYGLHGGGVLSVAGSTDISNCLITNNKARYGAGVYNHYYTNSVITNCTLSGNQATNYGGGISNVTYSNTTVINCIFCYNIADIMGGAINNHNFSTPAFINCTFAKNSAHTGGGCVNNTQNSYSTFVNSILWDNGEEFESSDDAAVNICQYSCVQGGYSGEANIASDPLFMDSYYRNYKLKTLSPCINAGTTQDAPLQDIEGLSREYGAGPDMGAHEYKPTDSGWVMY